MGTYGYNIDCPKCIEKGIHNSVQASGHTRNVLHHSGMCLECGWGFETKEFQTNKETLKEVRKAYGYKKKRKKK